MSRKWVWAILAVVIALVVLGVIGYYASPTPSGDTLPSEIPPPTTRTAVMNGTILYGIKPGWYTCNTTLYYDPERRLVILYTWLTMPKDLWLRFIGNGTAWDIEYAWLHKSPKDTRIWEIWVLVTGMRIGEEFPNPYNINATAWVVAMNETNVWSGVIVGSVYEVPSYLPSEDEFMFVWSTWSNIGHNYETLILIACPYKLKFASYDGYMGYMPIVSGIFEAPLPPQFVDATGYKVVGDLPRK